MRKIMLKLENVQFDRGKLEGFVQYAERIGLTEIGGGIRRYAPDMAAKKNGRIYIIEVKVNTG